jgi:hypothetical protein
VLTLARSGSGVYWRHFKEPETVTTIRGVGARSSMKFENIFFSRARQHGQISGLSAVTLSLLLLSGQSSAQVDPWELEVYPYATEAQGMAQFESGNAVVAKGHSQGGNGTSGGTFPSGGTWYQQFEVDYGLTNRLEADLMLDMAQPSAQGYWYAGSKYSLRGQLRDEHAMPIQCGWYAELEWRKTPQLDSNELQLDLRPIIEKDLNRVSVVLNPKFEKAIFLGPNKNRGFEFGYAVGVYLRWLGILSPGVEFYGGIGFLDDSEPLKQQQHYIFPLLSGELPKGVDYNIGPGFGLTRGSDRVLMKFNIGLERFVGMVWGP